MENHHFKVIVHCHVSFRGCTCIEMSLDDGTHVSSEMQHPTCSWTNMKVKVHIGFHGFWLASRQPVVASFWNCWKNMGIQFHTMTYRFQSSLDGRCPIWQTFFQVPWSTTQDGSFYMTRVLCFFSPNSLYQWWIGRLSPHNLPKAFNPKVVCAVNFGQSVKIHQEIHTTQRFWRFRRYVCSRYIYIYTHINKYIYIYMYFILGWFVASSFPSISKMEPWLPPWRFRLGSRRRKKKSEATVMAKLQKGRFSKGFTYMCTTRQ